MPSFERIRTFQSEDGEGKEKRKRKRKRKRKKKKNNNKGMERGRRERRNKGEIRDGSGREGWCAGYVRVSAARIGRSGA